MILNVFGRQLEIVLAEGKWLAFYPGNDGTRRKAQDIVIPDEITKAYVVEYVADLCHEWATPDNPDVKVVENSDNGA